MRICTILTTCCLLVLLAGVAKAGLEMPSELKEEFPQYADSQLLQVTNMGGAIIVMMNCGTANMETVYDFYLSKAKSNGWNVQMESKQQEVMLFAADKGNKKFMLNVAVEDGNTAVGMTLSSE